MVIQICGWSEPVATNAPVEDEVVQVVLGMNQKHILLCPKFLIFSTYSLPQSFSLLPTSLLFTSSLLPPSHLPPLSYLQPPPYLPHLILSSLHRQSSRVLKAGVKIMRLKQDLGTPSLELMSAWSGTQELHC
jgi:hypothetical protein